MAELLKKKSATRRQSITSRQHPVRVLCLTLTVVMVTLISWGWWTFVSPYGYSPPAAAIQQVDDIDHRVFVYGTLRNPLIRHLIVRAPTDAQPAILPGYKKQGLDIIADSEEKVTGLVFSVTAQGLRRLDRYERLGIRYERIMRPLADGEPAWIYRRLSE